MPGTEPTLLETYTAELKKQGVSEKTVTLMTAVAAVWIDVLRENPHRLSSKELRLLTMDRIAETFFNRHFDPLWGMVTDPDQGFGRMSRDMHPFLIE